MPVYNGEAYLSEAIDSILNQSHSSFELVIVDDGSTDRSLELIEEFNDPRIKTLKIDHQGLAKALNIGLKQCQYQYVARMDSDDYSYPDRLKKQAIFLDANPSVGVVSCKVEFQTDIENASGYKRYVDWTNELLIESEIYSKRFVESPIVHPSVMFRKKILNEFGDYDVGHLPEDYELWLRLMSNDVSFAKLNETLLLWHDRYDRLSRVHENYSEEAFYQVKAKYFKIWYDQQDSRKPIYIWGHGSKMKQRTKYLLDKGIVIDGYIDITVRSKVDYIHYEDINFFREGIILSFVANPFGKLEISKYLNNHAQMREGIDFFHFV